MPLIPALGWQRQADLCESEASLVYIARAVTEKSCLGKKKKTKKQIKRYLF